MWCESFQNRQLVPEDSILDFGTFLDESSSVLDVFVGRVGRARPRPLRLHSTSTPSNLTWEPVSNHVLVPFFASSFQGTHQVVTTLVVWPLCVGCCTEHSLRGDRSTQHILAAAETSLFDNILFLCMLATVLDPWGPYSSRGVMFLSMIVTVLDSWGPYSRGVTQYYTVFAIQKRPPCSLTSFLGPILSEAFIFFIFRFSFFFLLILVASDWPKSEPPSRQIRKIEFEWKSFGAFFVFFFLNFNVECGSSSVLT